MKIPHDVKEVMDEKNSMEQQQLKKQKEIMEREQQKSLEQQQKGQVEEENLIKATLDLSRGHLLLTLIDQVKSINLIFMKILLTRIKEFLEEEKEGGGSSIG